MDLPNATIKEASRIMPIGQPVHKLTSRLRRLVASSDLVGTIGRGLSWMSIGAVGSRALMLVASIFISRSLGVDGFGRYGMIQATLGTLGILAGAGLGMTITKFVAASSVSDVKKAGEIIGLVLLLSVLSGGGISVLAFSSAPWVSAHILADPNLDYLLRISSALVLFGAFNGVQFGALAGLQAFKAIALGTLVTTAITFLCTVIGAYTGGLAGACIGLTIAAAANCAVGRTLLSSEMARRQIRLSLSGIWQHRHILLSFSLPALLSNLLVDPVNWLCAALVVHQPGGYHQMGAFYAANQWLSALQFMPGLVAYVIFPGLSQAFATAGWHHPSKSLMIGIGLNAAITIPPAVILALGSTSIMGLYSPMLASEWKILDITLMTGPLMAIVAPIGLAIAASGRMWLGMALNTAWAGSYIILTLLLLPNGALGLASARAIAYSLHVIWSSLCAVWLSRLPRLATDLPSKHDV